VTLWGAQCDRQITTGSISSESGDPLPQGDRGMQVYRWEHKFQVSGQVAAAGTGCGESSPMDAKLSAADPHNRAPTHHCRGARISPSSYALAIRRQLGKYGSRDSGAHRPDLVVHGSGKQMTIPVAFWAPRAARHAAESGDATVAQPGRSDRTKSSGCAQGIERAHAPDISFGGGRSIELARGDVASASIPLLVFSPAGGLRSDP